MGCLAVWVGGEGSRKPGAPVEAFAAADGHETGDAGREGPLQNGRRLLGRSLEMRMRIEQFHNGIV